MKRNMKLFDLKDADGFVNGCLPSDGESEALQETLQASAVSFNQIYECGDMPIVKWDGNFELFLNQRAAVIEDMNFDNPGCTLPWNVARRLRANTLYYSQGLLGSCAGMAFGFAYSSSLLQNITLRGKQSYNPVNPLGAYVLSHGGRLQNGQNIATMAKWCNTKGNYLIKDIGEYQTKTLPDYTETARQHAAENQSAIVFIDGNDTETIVGKITACLKAGIAVALGNSVAVNGSTVDRQGMPLASFGGSWSHATHFCSAIRDGGQWYYFWVNSHGKRYKAGKYNETGDGCWMSETQLSTFLRSASQRYGSPAAVLAEGKTV